VAVLAVSAFLNCVAGCFLEDKVSVYFQFAPVKRFSLETTGMF